MGRFLEILREQLKDLASILPLQLAGLGLACFSWFLVGLGVGDWWIGLSGCLLMVGGMLLIDAFVTLFFAVQKYFQNNEDADFEDVSVVFKGDD